MTIQELHTRRRVLIEEARAIPNAARAADRTLTKEEKNRVDVLLANVARIDEQISYEKEFADLANGVKVPGAEAVPSTARRGRTYSDLFPGSSGNGGFKSFSEFLEVIHSGRGDSRLQAAISSSGMRESIGSDGGFLVAPEYAALLLDRSLETELIRPRASVWPMLTNERRVPALDENRENGVVYGFSGQWLGELQEAVEEQPALRELTLFAKKLACFSSCSNELLADANSFEEVLGTAMTRAIGFFLDKAYLTGSGAGRPLGVLNDPALIVQAKETSQTAATINYSNLIKMFSRLSPAFQQNAIWIASSSTIPQLMSLSISVGTGGSAIAVLSENDGVFRLLGKEVVFSEHMPLLGEQGDILIADLSAYLIGMRKEVTLDKSNAVRWLSDASSYRCIVRTDGMGSLPGPVKLSNGTLASWCVTLAARA